MSLQGPPGRDLTGALSPPLLRYSVSEGPASLRLPSESRWLLSMYEGSYTLLRDGKSCENLSRGSPWRVLCVSVYILTVFLAVLMTR